jgi:CheY-like chemotaxis protein
MALILLIEDDRTQRLAAGLALSRAGHHVIDAPDGEQGLELARAHRPDLIICDVLLPGVDGFQVVAALRDDPSTADIPVIILTSMADRAHMRIAMTSGADDYIAKPFAPWELRDSVSALLAKRRALRGQIVQSMSTEILTKLEGQKQELALQYETRLARELDARWSQADVGNADLIYDDAVLLVFDLAGTAHPQSAAGEDTGAAMRRVYQTASDIMYLFGAQHLRPYGARLLAVFVDDPKPRGAGAASGAVRAAFALVKALGGSTEPQLPASSEQAFPSNRINVALHTGKVTILQVSDPLHGGPNTTLVGGQAIGEALAVLDYASEVNWPVACSGAAAERAAGVATYGRNVAVRRDDNQAPLRVVELLAPN